MEFFERLLMAVLDLWFRFIPRRRPQRQVLIDCRIISHRGEHDNRHIYENTMAAFTPVAEAECWGLEFDLRWTRDLHPVLLHDSNLRRVFGIDLAVAQVDLRELQRRAPQVPTLAQVVERFGGRQHLMVELKRDRLGRVDVRAERLREIFASLEPARDYHFLALHPELFELVGFCGPRACLPVAQFNIGELSRLALQQGYGGVCAQYMMLSRKLIRHHHQQQQGLGSGFAASRFSFYRELNRDVDWIFTNHALRLLAIRRQLLGDA